MCPDLQFEANSPLVKVFFRAPTESRLTAKQKYERAINYVLSRYPGNSSEENERQAIFWCKAAINSGCVDALSFLLNALLVGGAGCIRKDLTAWEAVAQQYAQYNYLGRRFAHVFFEAMNVAQERIKAAIAPNIPKAIYYLRLALHDEDLETAEESLEILRQGLLEGKWAFKKDEATFNNILTEERHAIQKIYLAKMVMPQPEESETRRTYLQM